MEIWTSRNTSSNSGELTLDFFPSYGLQISETV